MKLKKAVNKLMQRNEKEYASAEPIGPRDVDVRQLESDVTDLDITEDDLPLDYTDIDVDDVEDISLTKDAKTILKRLSKDVETLIDALMAVNTEKKFSILIKLLQNAVRLADELLLTDDTLNKGK